MCLAPVRATLKEVECSMLIENEGFEKSMCGSQVLIEEVLGKVPSNWFLEADKRSGLACSKLCFSQ
jgi:hypothetical protein